MTKCSRYGSENKSPPKSPPTRWDVNVKIDNKEIMDFKWIQPKKALKMDLTEKSYKKTIKDYIQYKKGVNP